MKPRRCLFPTALLLLALPLACAAATPVYRTFGDWVVACDNGARCEAIGMQDAYPQLVLRLVLEGGPTAEPVLTLESDAPVIRSTCAWTVRGSRPPRWCSPAGAPGR